MTPEKRAAAIAWLQDEIRSLRMAPGINGCGPEPWADQLEIMETCLEAVTLTDRSTDRSTEPLTLEQLREMNGQQVYGKTFCDMCKGQYECDDCRLWWLQQPAEEDT